MDAKTGNEAPLFIPSMGMASGMAIASLSEFSKSFPVFLITGMFLVVGALFLPRKNRYSFVFRTCLSLLALSVASGIWYHARVRMVKPGNIALATPVGEVAVIGRIRTFPVFTRSGGRLDVTITGIETSRGRIAKRNGIVRLGLSQEVWNNLKNNPNFAPGAGIRFETVLKHPVGYRNSGSFQPARTLFNSSIHLSGYVGYTEFIQILTSPSPLSGFVSMVRTEWIRRLGTETLPGLPGMNPQTIHSISHALIVGSRGSLCPATRNLFQQTGFVHLLAISGLHTGMLAGVIFWILMKVPGNTRSRAFMTIVIIWCYAVFTGSSASVVRAALMITVLLIAKILVRPAILLNSVSVSAILLLLHKPGLIQEPGFQLTFSATIGIALLHPAFNKILKKISWKWLRNALSASFAAQCATAPAAAFWFNRFGLLSAPVGLPLIPVTAAALITGWLGPFLMRFDRCMMLKIHYAVTGVIVYFTDWTTNLKGMTVSVLTPTWYVAVILFGIIVSVYFFGNKPVPVIVCCIAIILVLVCQPHFASPGPGEMDIWFLDVGNGDCTVIRLPDGKIIVVDAGGLFDSELDIGEQVVVRTLRTLGIHRIDIAVITHYHPDHQLGMRAVLRHMKPSELWIRNERSEQNDFRRIIEEAKQRDVVIRSLETRDIFEVFQLCENNMSVVLGIRFGNFRLLLTGDAEREAESALSAYKRHLKSSVLKVGHHGSRSSSSEEFVKSVSPLLAVIPSGYANQFGHPHVKTLDTLKNASTGTLRSDIHGMIHITTDGLTMKTAWSTYESVR